MDDNIQELLKIVDDHQVSLDEGDIFDFLRITYRWPPKYPWGQPSIEIITQYVDSQQPFFDWLDGHFVFDEWKKYYDIGFTSIISNVLDLNAELRSLRDKIFQYTGTYINGNFYFSAGSTKNRVSFDPHNHNYNVILKPIYGTSVWQISGSEFETSKKSFLIPAGESHSVSKCVDKKLSLTLNIQ